MRKRAAPSAPRPASAAAPPGLQREQGPKRGRGASGAYTPAAAEPVYSDAVYTVGIAPAVARLAAHCRTHRIPMLCKVGWRRGDADYATALPVALGARTTWLAGADANAPSPRLTAAIQAARYGVGIGSFFGAVPVKTLDADAAAWRAAVRSVPPPPVPAAAWRTARALVDAVVVACGARGCVVLAALQHNGAAGAEVPLLTTVCVAGASGYERGGFAEPAALLAEPPPPPVVRIE